MERPRYVKQDPISHILMRPDMYVGSKLFETHTDLVFDTCIKKKQIDSCPALNRTFVEILSNAIDNLEREPKMTYIKVELTRESCSISNDGSWIPIAENEKEKMLNHTLIFGHLLSGSNYDDNETRFTSGRNGLGAKLTNVLSKEFTVSGDDPEAGLHFSQTWTNNMRTVSAPKITKMKRKKGMTTVAWSWDFKWFGIKQLSTDTFNLFKMQLFNTAMITGLKVVLNDEKMPNKLLSYFSYFQEHEEDSLKFETEFSRVIVTPSIDKEHETISFVNGVQTRKGGKHVTAWVEAFCRPIIDKLKSKNVGSNITIKDVKPFFRFLIVVKVPNPVFESQEKNELKGPNIQAPAISNSTVLKVLKWPVGNELLKLVVTKETKRIAQVSKKSIAGIEGYDKANFAASAKAKECTLIICEGLSAKTFAVEGLPHGLNGKRGRDWFGIYPLRGKLLNTRNASLTAIRKNKIITDLIQILNLDFTKPDDLQKMSYGKICILTDADVDGIHIEGLLLNFFHSLFPRILEQKIVFSMKTPIIRISTKANQLYFYDEQTLKHHQMLKGMNVKYYKGLGTTKPGDVKNVFGVKMLQFLVDSSTDQLFKTAFHKTKAEERKSWISNYSPFEKRHTLDDENESVVNFPISRHINLELIKFFHEDCNRNIPSVFDGLKESQRKIVYSAKKRKLVSEMKVAQFGAYVAEHTNYHHGEENLSKTIIRMAQKFPGTNNLPLLMDDGMFGTRLEGGEDASAPRYIFTRVSPYFDLLFPPVDDELLTYREEEGDTIEPYFFVPTLPLLLINGCLGIGTGWMSNVVQFSARSVLNVCNIWMGDDKDLFEKAVNELIPNYKGFNGLICKTNPNKFVTKGIYTRKENKIKVTELPIGMWNSKFKQILDELDDILTVVDHSTTTQVDFELTVGEQFDEARFQSKLETSLNLNNIVIFDSNACISKVSLVDVFELWGNMRLNLNRKRKEAQIANLTAQINKLENKIKFIQLVVSGQLMLTEKEEVVVEIIKREISADSNVEKALLDQPVRTLTKEKQTELISTKRNLEIKLDLISKQTDKSIWFDDVKKLEPFL